MRACSTLLLVSSLLAAGCNFDVRIGDPPDAGPLPYRFTHRAMDTEASHPPAHATERPRKHPHVASGAALPPHDPAAPEVAAPPPLAPSPPSEPAATGPVVLRLYPSRDPTPDPFGSRRAPRGVQVFRTTRRRGHGTSTPDRGPTDGESAPRWVGRTARVSASGDESLEEAIARVRPWFARLDVADDERFFFDLPRARGSHGVDEAEAFLVRDTPIEIYRADIHDAAVTEHFGGAFSVQVCWSVAGTRRLPEATRGLVGQTVAHVIDGGVLWAPHVGGPTGQQHRSTLVFLDGDRAFGERVVDAVLAGGDEVHTESPSPFPCGGP